MKELAAAIFTISLTIIANQFSDAHVSKTSPDYCGKPEQLTYVEQMNIVFCSHGRPVSGQLIVTVRNNGKTPARGIRVVIKPVGNDPHISTNAKHQVYDGLQGCKVIEIDNIAPLDFEKIVVDERIPRSAQESMDSCELCASVYSVKNDFGAIRN